MSDDNKVKVGKKNNQNDEKLIKCQPSCKKTNIDH